MEFGLKDNTIEKIIQVFASIKEIDRAIIYGSRAKGTIFFQDKPEKKLLRRMLH